MRFGVLLSIQQTHSKKEGIYSEIRSRSHFINDIQFASESKIENGVLYVDEEAVKAIVLEDEKIKGVKFDIAKPGESVRITPVKDVIEPRVKVEGRGESSRALSQKLTL